MLTDQRPLTANFMNAFRAFEAAARRGSFVAAAQELFVSPPAVSQLVRTLEDYVGKRLFERGQTGVTLTPDGAAVYPQVRDGLALLAGSLDRLKRGSVEHEVTISVTPAFASLWLMPRIQEFVAKVPGVNLKVESTNRLVDFTSEKIDLGVRYGSGAYLGLGSRLMMKELIFPVASPALLEKQAGGDAAGSCSLKALAGATLIHDTTMSFDAAYPTWQTWSSQVGGFQLPGRSLQFNSPVLALQAAVDGLGIALARSALASRYLADGRLVRIDRMEMESPRSYYIVFPRGFNHSEEVSSVMNWLVTAGAEDEPASLS